MAGAMIAANLGGFPQKGKLMLVGGLWMGGLFIAFTQMSMFIPALFMLALGNVGGMIFQTTNNTVIQSNIPAEVRGRVMSVMMMSFGLMPLGVLPVTLAADHFGAVQESIPLIDRGSARPDCVAVTLEAQRLKPVG